MGKLQGDPSGANILAAAVAADGSTGGFVKDSEITTDGLVITADQTFGLTVQRTSDSTLGGGVKFKHVSASPAASDFVGFFNAYGNDSGGNETLYGFMQVIISDPADGSEKGLCYFGASGGDTLKVGQGIYTNNATSPGVTNVIAAYQVKTQSRTVAQLPAAGTVGNGTRGYVSDSTLAYASANIGSAVTGGGANHTPVIVLNGAWVIG